MISKLTLAIREPMHIIRLTLLALALLILCSPGLTAGAQSSVAGSTSSISNKTTDGNTQKQPEATCPAGGQCFADVPAGNSFYEFINRIYMQDLVSGYPCGGTGEPCDAENRPYYRPGGLVTRQQMAKFIDNARRLPQISIFADSTEPLIYADNHFGSAIRGDSYSNNDGIDGTNWASGRGVYGQSISGIGVHGHSASGYGVYGSSASGYAGYFTGNIYVGGSCTGCAGPTRIDHPLDPENKYLYHSPVQSPDMKTIYDGVVTLDANGEAVVVLPEWFEAVNRDFRYQLTPMGAPGPNLYVAEKIKHNRFKIAGGSPGMEVSWQVTGIRHDPYAQAHPVSVEEDKPADERGKYLHPIEWGQPESKGVDYEERQKMQEQIQEADER